MVLAVVLLASLAVAIAREMVLRPIPLAVALAILFALIRADVGPFIAFGAPLMAWVITSAALDAMVHVPVRSMRLGALALCGAASFWVATQLALSASQLLAQ